MLNPGIGKLIDKYENKYQLVLDVAKRARIISERADEDDLILNEKPVTTAINQLSHLTEEEINSID